MTYKERLSPWCIIRLLPNLQRLVIARCRRRGDAEAHLQLLQRMAPATYVIVFDPVIEVADSAEEPLEPSSSIAVENVT